MSKFLGPGDARAFFYSGLWLWEHAFVDHPVSVKIGYHGNRTNRPTFYDQTLHTIEQTIFGYINSSVTNWQGLIRDSDGAFAFNVATGPVMGYYN